MIKLISQYAPDAIKTVEIGELAGWGIALDISIAIHQWCSVGRNRNIVNADGKFVNHIQGAFYRLAKLTAAGIKLICVFDGKPPAAKAKTIAMRKENRESIPREVFAEVKKLVEKMGITVLQADGEAELTAAILQINGTVNAVATEDTDAIAFGARYIIRGLDSAARTVTIIDREVLLNKLQLDAKQFIDLCILMGCDYSGTLPGIGYVRALKLIKKHHSIEEILRAEKIIAPADFTYEIARNEFSRRIIVPKIALKIEKLSVGEKIELNNFLSKEHKLLPGRIQRTLAKL